MRQKQLQRRLILEAVAITVVISGLLSLVFAVGAMLADYQKRAKELELSVSVISAERAGLRTKYDNTQQNMSIYQEALQKNPRDERYLGRQVVQRRFDQYQNRFGMRNMRLTMTPRQELSDPKYKRKDIGIAVSEMTLTFETALDENIYMMIAIMQRELLGIVKITSMKIERQNPLNDTAITNLSQEGAASLLKGEIHMQWLGIKQADANAAAAAGPGGINALPR